LKTTGETVGKKIGQWLVRGTHGRIGTFSGGTLNCGGKQGFPADGDGKANPWDPNLGMGVGAIHSNDKTT